MRNSISPAVAVAACAVGLFTASVRADTLYGDFTSSDQPGAPPSASFTLAPDGTIIAQVSVADLANQGGMDGIGISTANNEPESGFSPSNAEFSSWSVGKYGGLFESGVIVPFLQSNFPSTINWVIGSPGEFTSVSQLFTPNAGGYEIWVDEVGGNLNPRNEFGGIVTATVPVPLPATAWLLLAGLGGLGALGARSREVCARLGARTSP